jgi:hypothetical protein
MSISEVYCTPGRVVDRPVANRGFDDTPDVTNGMQDLFGEEAARVNRKG